MNAIAQRGSTASRYLQEIRACRSQASEDDLVTPNLAFVVKVAGEYRNMGLPFEDLLNEGNVGLIEAARRFDPSRGARFISYATWWIRKSILKALSENASIVHIPEYQRKQARTVRDTGRHLGRSLGREAGRDEISRELGVTVARVDRLLQMQMRDLSLDETLGEDRDTTVLEKMADERAPDPEDVIIRRQNRALLRRALAHLSARQLAVIVQRFGLAGERSRTLAEIGDRMGMSREGVRQIETQATNRLRRAMVRRPRPRLATARS
jgi:RNA polymerase primary sigma factor